MSSFAPASPEEPIRLSSSPSTPIQMHVQPLYYNSESPVSPPCIPSSGPLQTPPPNNANSITSVETPVEVRRILDGYPRVSPREAHQLSCALGTPNRTLRATAILSLRQQEQQRQQEEQRQQQQEQQANMVSDPSPASMPPFSLHSASMPLVAPPHTTKLPFESRIPRTHVNAVAPTRPDVDPYPAFQAPASRDPYVEPIDVASPASSPPSTQPRVAEPVCVLSPTPEKPLARSPSPPLPSPDAHVPLSGVRSSPQSPDIDIDVVSARTRNKRSREDPYGAGVHGLAVLGGEKKKEKPRPRRCQPSMFGDDEEDDPALAKPAKKAKPAPATRPKGKPVAKPAVASKSLAAGKKTVGSSARASRADDGVKPSKVRKRAAEAVSSSDDDFVVEKESRSRSGKRPAATSAKAGRAQCPPSPECAPSVETLPSKKRARRDTGSSSSPFMNPVGRQTRSATKRAATGKRRLDSEDVPESEAPSKGRNGLRRSTRTQKRRQERVEEDEVEPEVKEEESEEGSSEECLTQESGSQPLVLNITAFKIRKRKEPSYPDHVRRKLDTDELSMLRLAFVRFYPPPPSNMQAHGRFEMHYGREMTKAMKKGLWEKELKPWSDRWWKFYGDFNVKAREHKLAKPDNRNPKINQTEADRWAKAFYEEHGDARLKPDE